MRPASASLSVVLLLVPSAALAQGNPVGPEFGVNTYTTSNQVSTPGSVAADSSGNFVVVWHNDAHPGSWWDVFARRYDSSGIPLGPEFRVNTYTTGFQALSSVAVDSSGNFVVVWTSAGQDGSGYGIFGQRYASSGAPLGPEFRVNTYTKYHQYGPSVAADSSGNFVVVWDGYYQFSPDWGVFGQRFASSGAPLGAEFSVNSYTTGQQFLSSVTATSAGSFVVAWTGDDQGSFDVFAQRYASSGARLGPEFRINTYTTNEQALPLIAADASGNFVVVWESYYQDGSSWGVFGQRYDSSGAPLGPEFRVNTSTGSYQFDPFVAADSSGNFVVVWQGYVGLLDADTFGQRFASSGAPLGPEFRVNSYVASYQGIPSVVADAPGNFVVVWNSLGQDGSGWGVFGQRYSMIVPVELMHFRVE